MAQPMPLPLTVSCFSKIQIGFTFLVPGSPGKRAVKRVCGRNITATTTTVLRPLRRSTCVSRHLQLRTGEDFVGACKVFLLACPCGTTAASAFGLGYDAGVLVNSVNIYTVYLAVATIKRRSINYKFTNYTLNKIVT